MAKVSVIIPIYKSEKFLPRTLESVRAQTYSDLEVICVDDCSPDRSKEVIKEYAAKDSRVRYLAHEKNMGAPAFGRNTGLAAAEGDFITFLDHDDTFLPTKLEELLKAMEREKVDFICSNCQLINNATGKVDMLAWGGVSGDPKAGFARRLLEDNFVPPNSTLIRRSVFQVVKGFDTSLKGVDDYDLWYRIVRQFPAAVLNKPLATWRYLNEGSISANQALMIQDETAFYEKVKALPEAAEWEQRIAGERIIRNKGRLANQQLVHKKYEEAVRLYAESGNTAMKTWVSRVPGLVRLAYLARRRVRPQFSPIELVFSHE